MSDILTNLGDLFHLSASSIIGVRDNSVIFCNPSAEKFFPSPLGKSSADDLFPNWPYEVGALVSTQVLGANCIISVSAFEDVKVLTVTEPINEKAVAAIPVGALSAMASNITTLRMAADIIVSSGNADERHDMYTSILYHNYFKILRTVEQLSIIAGLTTGSYPCNTKSIELGSLMMEIMSSVKYMTAEHASTIEYVSPNELITVNADSELIERLVLNLISNSLRHTSEGGRITIRLTKSQKNAVITVSDTGSGIPPETLSTVFQLNKPLHPFGIPDSESGLGLPLTSVIASKHKGTVVIDSAVGRGTAVRVMIRSLDIDSAKLRAETFAYKKGASSLVQSELSTSLPKEQYAQSKMLDT